MPSLRSGRVITASQGSTFMIHGYDVRDAMRLAAEASPGPRRGGGHGSIDAKYGTDPACCSAHVLTA